MINWKEWLKAAGTRAIRTFAESALAYIGTGAVVLGDVNWLAALSAGLFGAVTALLLALSGLPEVKPVPVALRSEAGSNASPSEAEAKKEDSQR